MPLLSFLQNLSCSTVGGFLGAQCGLQLHTIRNPDLLEPSVSGDTAMAFVIMFTSLASGLGGAVVCAVAGWGVLTVFFVGGAFGLALYAALVFFN